MDEPTLQSIIREKYNINDHLLAEGRFVGLMGDHAANLVCLGLGMRCFVIAKVVLSGDVMDYDLISLTPLPVLALSFQATTKKIIVKSQFKSIQIYQMCTSARQAEVWDDFTSIIEEFCKPKKSDIWCSATFQVSDTSRATDSTDFYKQLPTMNYATSFTTSNLLLQTDENNNSDVPSDRSCNLDLNDIHFDSFVNDSRESTENIVNDITNGTITDTLQLLKPGQNINMNANDSYSETDSKAVTENMADIKIESGLRRFLKKALAFCVGRKE